MGQALQGAHRGGAHGRDASAALQRGDEGAEQRPVYAHGLCVHGMLPYGVALHRLEGARPHVQRQLARLHPLGPYGFQDRVGEMQPGGGGRHRTLYLGVDSLVVHRVGLLALTAEVWRDGYEPGGGYHVGESQRVRLPSERDVPRSPGSLASQGGGEGEADTVRPCTFLVQLTPFPALDVAHQAHPAARALGLESLRVVARLVRLKAENLYLRARRLAHTYAGVDDAGIVAHHKRPWLQQLRQVGEGTVFRLSGRAAHQQAARVARLARMARYLTVRQRIVVVGYP